MGDDHLEPDAVVFPPGVTSATRRSVVSPPLLVIEITSPSTRRRDAGIKRWGIPEYWELDPERPRLMVS
jgi:Uma2 family endonuclease